MSSPIVTPGSAVSVMCSTSTSRMSFMWPVLIFHASPLLEPSLVDMAAKFGRAVRSLRVRPAVFHASSCAMIDATFCSWRAAAATPPVPTIMRRSRRRMFMYRRCKAESGTTMNMSMGVRHAAARRNCHLWVWQHMRAENSVSSKNARGSFWHRRAYGKSLESAASAPLPTRAVRTKINTKTSNAVNGQGRDSSMPNILCLACTL